MSDDTNNNEGDMTTQTDAPGDEGKIFAILGYLFPILFFIPLLIESTKQSPYSRFHANQQLNMLLFGFIAYVVSALLMFVVIGVFLMPLVSLAMLVLMVMGILNVIKEQLKPLPIIGKYTILK